MAVAVAHDMGTAPEPHYNEKERAPEQKVEIGFASQNSCSQRFWGLAQRGPDWQDSASRETGLTASETTYSNSNEKPINRHSCKGRKTVSDRILEHEQAIMKHPATAVGDVGHRWVAISSIGVAGVDRGFKRQTEASLRLQSQGWHSSSR